MLLERPGQKANMDAMLEFHSVVMKGFKDKMEKLTDRKKKEKEEYKISVNYGIASLYENVEVDRIFRNFTESKNITIADDEASFMVINDSKESLLFKNYKETGHIVEDLGDLSSPDVYEDISLGVINK